MKKTRLTFRTGDPARDRIMGEIAVLNFKGLQKECIVRGKDFEGIINEAHGTLSDWLYKNWNNRRDEGLLQKFDEWVDSKLAKKYGPNDPIRLFKKFTMPPEQEEETPKPEKKPKEKKVKKVREKNKELGVYSGTKKELTYSLSEKLYNKFGKKYDAKTLVKKFAGQMLSKVSKRFADANEKSVRIWMKRYLDGKA